MKLSAYMYNLFMTVIILIFLLVAYLYYKIRISFKEAFQTSDDKFIVNNIDVSNMDPNNIDINKLNLDSLDIKRINANISRNDLNKLETVAKSTDGEGDVFTNVNTQCKLYKKQIDVLGEKLDEYRFQGRFNDLSRTYSSIETIKDKMKLMSCNN